MSSGEAVSAAHSPISLAQAKPRELTDKEKEDIDRRYGAAVEKAKKLGALAAVRR